mgnify:CR=1 FL=1
MKKLLFNQKEEKEEVNLNSIYNSAKKQIINRKSTTLSNSSKKNDKNYVLPSTITEKQNEIKDNKTRINNFINNFRPINRRFNDKRLNKRRKPLLPPARPMIPLREIESESEPEEQDKNI